LTLVGYSDITRIPTDVAAPGVADPDRALGESLARMNQAINEMGGKDVADAQPTTSGPYVPSVTKHRTNSSAISKRPIQCSDPLRVSSGLHDKNASTSRPVDHWFGQTTQSPPFRMSEYPFRLTRMRLPLG